MNPHVKKLITERTSVPAMKNCHTGEKSKYVTEDEQEGRIIHRVGGEERNPVRGFPTRRWANLGRSTEKNRDGNRRNMVIMEKPCQWRQERRPEKGGREQSLVKKKN